MKFPFGCCFFQSQRATKQINGFAVKDPKHTVHQYFCNFCSIGINAATNFPRSSCKSFFLFFVCVFFLLLLKVLHGPLAAPGHCTELVDTKMADTQASVSILHCLVYWLENNAHGSFPITIVSWTKFVYRDWIPNMKLSLRGSEVLDKSKQAGGGRSKKLLLDIPLASKLDFSMFNPNCEHITPGELLLLLRYL